MTEPIDYKTMYECAAEFARSLIQEANSKDEEIRRLEAEIRELQEQAEELRFNPNHDPKNGRFTSGNGVDILGGSGIIKLNDIEIGRSVSAKAKNYDIMDLQTGEIFHFAEGTKIQDVYVFAGKGSSVAFRKADKYAERYGGKPADWQHCKGKGVIDFYGEERKAEVHWVQCDDIGKHEFFIKGWID